MTTTRYRIPAQVMTRQVGVEIVLLQLASGTYFGLDPVGARAWQLLAEHRSLDAVCTMMIDEYEVSPETLRRDLLSLVESLCESGLLEEEPGD